MGKHGKQGSLTRWQDRELKGINKAIQLLAKKIQIVPLKNGCIMCLLGDAQSGNIHFMIEQKIVFDAAEAGIKFAEELKQKAITDAGAEASTQPVRSE